MPASPAWRSAMKSCSCDRRVLLLDDPVADVGRSKLAMKRGAPSRRSRSTISLRVSSSAVAVSAIRGTSRKALGEHRQPDVLRAEIVPPLRDAMRLVDREQRDARRARAGRGSAASAAAPARHRADRARPRAGAARPRTLPRSDSVEFSTAALTPASRSAATWSRISAISGETTMPQPSRSSAGNW